METTKDDLSGHFGRYRSFRSVRFIANPTGPSGPGAKSSSDPRKEAFVEYGNESDASKAEKDLNGSKLKSATIVVWKDI